MIFQKSSGLITLKKKVLNWDVAAKVDKETSSGYSENSEENYNDLLDADICELEVKKAIQRLRSGEAAEVDSILAEMLKAAEHKII